MLAGPGGGEDKARACENVGSARVFCNAREEAIAEGKGETVSSCNTFRAHARFSALTP